MQPGNPSTNHYESPSVQQAGSFVETSGIPKRGWNTLGPGGRKVHQAPEQVLGKRGQAQQQDSDSGHSSVLNGTQQQEQTIFGAAPESPDEDARRKRRQNNATPGTQPRPKPRRRRRKSLQPQRYGAGGAPEPLPPEVVFETNTQPAFDLMADAEGLLMSPEELFGSMPDVFDFDGSQDGC